MTTIRCAAHLLRRDMILLRRNPTTALLPLLFFVMMTAIFPLTLGPSAQTLNAAAPAIIWSAALLSSLLTQDSLFRHDAEDGTLEQMLLSGRPMALLALTKTAMHWLSFGVPLIFVAPLLGIWLAMEDSEVWRLMLTLPLGAGVFSLFSVFTAALLAAERTNSFLGALICLPLCLPAIIFAAAAARGESAPLLLLAALFVFSLTVLPLATGGALRIGISS